MYHISSIGLDDYMVETDHMLTHLQRFSRDESGATAIEYGLIAALVSMAGIAALHGLGDSLSNLFTSISGFISEAVNGV